MRKNSIAKNIIKSIIFRKFKIFFDLFFDTTTLKIILKISATGNFTFKIGNSRVAENIFPKQISHHFLKNQSFLKYRYEVIVRKNSITKNIIKSIIFYKF